MLNEMQNEKMLQKLERLLQVCDAYFFETVDTLDFQMFQTAEHLRKVPPEEVFGNRQDFWGGEGQTCWFRGVYQPKPEQVGLSLYVRPEVGGYEAMLWVNGQPVGTYATKIVVTRHGNHYCDLITLAADPQRNLDIAIEFYAGHTVIGCQPFETNINNTFNYPTGTIDICVKNQLVIDFAMDLRVLIQLVRKLDQSSFRRAEIMNTLTEVHQVVLYSPENCERSVWLESLRLAKEKMRSSLNRKNGDSAAKAALIGHSHMDTAWLWTIDETIRKNARTVSNQLSLMKQYPEYKFIQSSAYHMQMIEKEYPDIFEEMKTRIAEGRFEPNGAVWIECDCNITSGEALIRQFLWGQRYTREKFDYTADCFWLPDTFGYAAAIPQIMQGCKVKYFLTTKLAWNDTNQFPYETFVWRGLDGSEVITHFFEMDTWPDSASLLERLDGIGYKNHIRAKQAFAGRLIAFGFGDGGGGPQFEMIEAARRLENLEGCPRVNYSTVSEFMDEISDQKTKLPVYDGELYLELHRGTLTSKQQIKKNNRRSEIALHNLDFLEVLSASMADKPATDNEYRELWKTLLVNQFHDILPGTCIPAAHNQSLQQTGNLLEQTTILIDNRVSVITELAASNRPDYNVNNKLVIINTLGFDRSDDFYALGHIDIEKTNMFSSGISYQHITDIGGEQLTAISGVTLPALGLVNISIKRPSTNEPTQQIENITTIKPLQKIENITTNEPTSQIENITTNEPTSKLESITANEPTSQLSHHNENITTITPFAISDDLLHLQTPIYDVHFNQAGFISSLIDRRNQRQLCGDMPLNTFVSAEDVPAAWDGWDIDADCIIKLQPDARLISREIASIGPVEFRIRSTYDICSSSKIEQDMIFCANSPLITFDTMLSWHDKHRLLKTVFETTIRTPQAKCEIQFGNISRPTTKNNSYEQAMFEVCNHKYTDLSEPGYGISLINDCKYGIGIDGTTLSLTLAKGGLRPDARGDEGKYRFRYALLPHPGGFSAENVVLPAYTFNYPPIIQPLTATASAHAATASAHAAPVAARAPAAPVAARASAASAHAATDPTASAHAAPVAARAPAATASAHAAPAPTETTAAPTENISFAATDRANVLIETIKPCEDSAKAYILRLYECEGTAARTGLRFMTKPKSIFICNMLEEKISPADEIFEFKPFEIKTLRVEY